MKKNLSPGVVALVIAVLVIVIGLFYMKGGGPGGKADEIEKAIETTVVKPGATMPAPGAPAQTPATAPTE